MRALETQHQHDEKHIIRNVNLLVAWFKLQYAKCNIIHCIIMLFYMQELIIPFELTFSLAWIGWTNVYYFLGVAGRV